MAKEPEKQEVEKATEPTRSDPFASARPQAAPQPAGPRLAQATADEPEKFGPDTPYTGPDEIVPGGCYAQKTTLKGGKHYGGEVANGKGDVLAVFDHDQVNTGHPSDGKLTEEGKKFLETAKEKGKAI